MKSFKMKLNNKLINKWINKLSAKELNGYLANLFLPEKVRRDT